MCLPKLLLCPNPLHFFLVRVLYLRQAIIEADDSLRREERKQREERGVKDREERGERGREQRGVKDREERGERDREERGEYDIFFTSL